MLYISTAKKSGIQVRIQGQLSTWQEKVLPSDPCAEMPPNLSNAKVNRKGSLLGTSAKLQNTTTSFMSVRLSIRPHGTTRLLMDGCS
jgi:hypothetical protein